MPEPMKVPEWKPGMPSRWVVVGGSGQRVVDMAVAVAAVARMMMLDHGEQRAAVHEGRCGLGHVDASIVGMVNDRPVVDRCTCTPTVVERS